MAGFTEVTDTLCSITDKTVMEKFCQEIFTSSERIDIDLRWRLMKMLKLGISQRNIAKELQVSLCKITRGSKIINNPDSITNQLL